MSRRGVPLAKPRSRSDVDDFANRCLRQSYPERLSTPGRVSVHDFLEFFLPDRMGIIFAVDDTLPPPIEAVMMPRTMDDAAQILVNPRVYDGIVLGWPRPRFTGAHEAGHLLLHEYELGTQLVEGNFAGLYRRENVPNYRDPEVQANWFASSFLMPRPAVELALKTYGPKTMALADIFGVSETAIRYRLGDFGFR